MFSRKRVKGLRITCLNVSATPITAMGGRQCLPLSVVQLKGKHCRNGIVDTFGPLFVQSCPVLCWNMNRGWDLCCTFIQLYDSPMDKIDDLGLRVGKEDDNRDAHTIRFNYCTVPTIPNLWWVFEQVKSFFFCLWQHNFSVLMTCSAWGT